MSSLDFAGINAAALSACPGLLESWFPAGRVEGREFKVGDLQGAAGDSLSVNTETGAWADFAEDARGGDLIDLRAAMDNTDMGTAARAVARDVGMSPDGNGSHDQGCTNQRRAPQTRRHEFVPVVPVPDDAPVPSFEALGRGLPSKVWTYRDAHDRVLFHVARFDKGDGKKDVLPLSYCAHDDGRRAWKWKSATEPRPLYRLDLLARYPEASVLILEGEKAADAAQAMCGERIVCMTWPGGSKAVGKVDWSPLKGRRVCLWPDNDKPGFAAMLHVTDTITRTGGEVVAVVMPPANWTEGADVADFTWTPQGLAAFITENKTDVPTFRQAAKERFGIEHKPHVVDRSTEGVPPGFMLKRSGVYFLEEDGDGNITHKKVCSWLRVVALTRDENGVEWGRLLELVDPDDQQRRWAMPMSMTAGDGNDYRAYLASLGLCLEAGSKARNLLQIYLTAARPKARARCVDRIGWHGDVFVLPDSVTGHQRGEEVVLQGGPSVNAFMTSGTLQEWQEHVGRGCAGNSRLVLAVCAAFAGPLLKLVGAESGGFHFVGGSSLGKTTMLQVAGSVCGGGGLNGFTQSWRTTDNGLESVAMGRCDTLLCLDEMSQVDSRVAAATSYMLANGTGKTRAKRTGDSRKPFEWRLVFLSTGEITLADKIREDGRGRAMAGQEVRVVDIPADAGAGLGAFEDLHGAASGDVFSRELKDAVARYYGTPFRSFLDALMPDRDTQAEQVTAYKKHFLEQVCPTDADGQVRRVCDRFALLAAAGEAATAFGVLPWPKGEATRAAKRCFDDWLAQRGGTGAAEEREGLAQVSRFFANHGSSRFEPWGDNAVRIHDRVGFVRDDEEHGKLFYVQAQALRRDICKGIDRDRIVALLVKLGIILPSQRGEAYQKHRVPNLGTEARLYVFTSAVFDVGEES